MGNPNRKFEQIRIQFLDFFSLLEMESCFDEKRRRAIWNIVFFLFEDEYNFALRLYFSFAFMFFFIVLFLFFKKHNSFDPCGIVN